MAFLSNYVRPPFLLDKVVEGVNPDKKYFENYSGQVQEVKMNLEKPSKS